jgi:hypothetical protein
LSIADWETWFRQIGNRKLAIANIQTLSPDLKDRGSPENCVRTVYYTVSE